jgi:outer membrane protein OmpA-like peptidoglycan-associated protein
MATGYGEEKPIVSNDDERDGREINRRVEFKVMRFIQ